MITYISPLLQIHPSAMPPPIRFKRKEKNRETKKKKNFIVVAVVWHMSHTVHYLVHFPLLSSTHCKESLLWFEASGFCFSINTGPSLGILLDILLLLVPWRCCRFGSVGPMPSFALEDHRWGDLGIAQLIALVLGWVVAGLISLPAVPHAHTSSPVLSQLVHPMQQGAKGRASSPAFTSSGPTHPHLYHQGQLCSAAQARGWGFSP